MEGFAALAGGLFVVWLWLWVVRFAYDRWLGGRR